MDFFKKLIYRIKLDDPQDRELYSFMKKMTGRYPKNLSLYRSAFTHSSKPNKNAPVGYDHNERLEFLGDAVLGMIITHHLVKMYPDKREGELTKLKANLVSRKVMNEFADRWKIADRLVCALDDLDYETTSVFGNCVEALIGAVYLDQGYKASVEFVVKQIYEKNIDLVEKAKNWINSKSLILEWGQKNKAKILFKDYRITEDKKRIFVSAIFINGVQKGEGKGFSKKEAEQSAAAKALEALDVKSLD